MNQQPPLHEVETQALQQNLNTLYVQEETLQLNHDRVSSKLGNLALSDIKKEFVQHETASVVGERSITDPLKPEQKNTVAPETLTSKVTLGLLAGKLAAKNSIYTPEGKDRAERVKTALESPLQNKRRAKAEIRLAERLRKHELRQERTRNAEVIFGGGIGLGKEAKVRTFFDKTLEKRKLKKEHVKARMKPGVDVNAQDYLDKLSELKGSSVTVPTKELRRNMRRERAGAIFLTGRALKSNLNPVTKIRKSRLNKKQVKLNSRINNTISRRAEIEAELLRRAEED